MNFLLLTIYSLTVFRLALLFSSDTGPWGMFSRLRSFLKREARHNRPLRQSKLHLGISCIRCESIWMATPVALYAVFKQEMPGWFSMGGRCRAAGPGVVGSGYFDESGFSSLTAIHGWCA